jgi:phosphoglycolate phosphatase
MKTISLDNYASVIFDLDGTLLDTLQDIAEAANRSLEKSGYPTHPLAAFKKLVGDGPDVLFQRAIGAERPDDPEILTLVESYQQERIIQDDRTTHSYPGIDQLLNQLTEQGIALAVLTNKHQPHAELCMQRFLHAWNWQVILGSGPHIPKKPDPQGALQVATTLNCSPQQCLYLGDTDVDMWTAKRAGMTAVGVLWGFRESEELDAAGADTLIQHPTHLLT